MAIEHNRHRQVMLLDELVTVATASLYYVQWVVLVFWAFYVEIHNVAYDNHLAVLPNSMVLLNVASTMTKHIKHNIMF